MDKYIKIKKIGEGSFGKALLVKSKQNGRQMVVKEINMSRMSRKEREEARKETAVLAQLNHPSIVSYRESFEEIGNLYIVMDYCDGGDLYGKINAQRGMLFPETQILDWFVQLCLAVKHIHDRKILHRDIKSQNIFLTRNAIVKLGDFGIAKVLNSTVELARTCIGTPYYLSPEICENKPYNNKSDIWSIGCVLYELTTLKHAFEAGNMKNLVLKIIRGSYPPVSPKYSYELRNLIAQLFKRNPRDRPSINSVLRKPLLTKRIQRFLSDSEFQDEFSHTVMHGQKIRKALPPGPTPARAPAARKAAPVPTPRYNPASVYAPSVARRSRDKENRKSADVVRRPNSAGGPKEPVDIAKKRQELVEKERQRREAIKKKEQQFANKHKDLIERQKAARINKAREEGWKNLVDSLGSDEGDKQPDKPVAKKPTPRQVEPPLAAASPPVKRGGPVPLNERGNYDQYNAWLDKLQQERRRTPGVAIGVGGAGGGFGGQAARRAEVASVQGANAAGNAKVVSDFLDRKKQAAQNKARAYGDMHGVAAALSPRPVHKPPAGGAAVSGRNQEEAEYLARLKQIRLQNFNERRNAKEKQGKVNPQYKPSAAADKYDADARRKKIEALRAQADERAQRLKEQLEKKRQEAFQLEQQRLRKEAKGPSKPAAPAKLVKAPIGMTAAMDAIGAGAEKEAAKSPLQKKKEEILKRLNAKPPVSERPKWGEPVKPPIAEERPKWGEADGANLGKLSLEETASAMDATSARDVVVKHDAGAAAGSSEAVSARKRWGGPAGTALNVLQGADIIESPDSTTGSKPESPETTVPSAQAPTGAPETENRAKAPIIGSTITIVRSPSKGTVVIKKVDNPENSSEIKDNKDGADLSVKPPEPVDQTNVSTDDDDADHKAVEIDKRASAEEPKENKDQEVKKSKLFEKVDLDDQEEVKDKDKGDMEVEELETKDEEEEEEDEDLQGSDSGKAEVAIGLTTGQFDVGDTKLLRTCSEPDLAKLFRTTLTLNEFFRGRTRVESVSASLDIDALVGGDLDADDDNGDDDDDDVQAVADAYAEAGAATEEQEDEEEDTESAKKAEDESQESSESADQKEKEDTEGKEDEDDDEVVDDDEDDDMETLRESMMCLLEDDNEDAKEQPISTPRKKRAKKGTKPTKGKKKRAKSRKPEDNEEENEEGPESEMSFKRQWSNSTDDDMRSLRETMASVLQESLSPVVAKARAVNKAVKKLSTVKKAPPPVSSDEPDVGPGGDNNGNSQASEGVDSEENTIVPEKESWQSDSSEEDGQFFEEDDDMFSRMEETRVKLEHELGCDTFLKAYKAVQAIHEDEDDNMEEGVTLVCSILGDDKEHLYPNILQLVMADGAFTEDND